MRISPETTHGIKRAFGLLCVALLFAGCASGKQVDWNSRIGTYTFDQAVLELGPPDKQAELSDGTLVAEWETARGYYIPGRPIAGRYRDPVFYSPDMSSPSWFLRLFFDKDKRLTDSKKFAK